MARGDILDALRVGDHVELSDGRTGWLNKLTDVNGKSRRYIDAGTAQIILDSDIPLGDLAWDDIEITVPIEDLTRI